MKAKLLFTVVLFLFFSLSACSQDTNQPDNAAPDVTENEITDNPDQNREAPEENKQDTDDSEANLEDDQEDDQTSEPQQYQNEAFKDVTISEKDDQMIVTGKARVFEGVFQYRVLSGTDALLEDHYQTEGAPAWGEFELTINKELIKNPGTTLELFTYSAKDGAKMDTLTIPLN